MNICFFTQNYSQDLDPVLSVVLRGMDCLPTTTEGLRLPDEVWSYELLDKYRKAKTLPGLQYNTPEEKTEEEICEFLSKFIAVLHHKGAHEMRIKENLFKEPEIKNSLLDMESIICSKVHGNFSVLDILEISREIMGKSDFFFKLLPSQHRNTYASALRDFFEGMSNWFLSISNQTKETAEVQQISEIELD